MTHYMSVMYDITVLHGEHSVSGLQVKVICQTIISKVKNELLRLGKAVVLAIKSDQFNHTLFLCVLSGIVKWNQSQPTGLRSTVPVLSVPDLDGDQVSDVALVASDDTQVNSHIIHNCFIHMPSLYLTA